MNDEYCMNPVIWLLLAVMLLMVFLSLFLHLVWHVFGLGALGIADPMDEWR